jgi:serine/threonine-protein kinase
MIIPESHPTGIILERPPMYAADRNLLFGLLALQNGLINQGQLVAAFQAWTLDKSLLIADQLVARGDLDAEQRAGVEAMVALHLKKYGGDIEKSLAALHVGRSTCESLARIGEADLEVSLAHVGAASTQAAEDVDRTATYSVGSATSEGQRFRVLRPHAKGGLGAVFVALDAELHREVALKQILDEHADDPTSRQRFLLEAEITGGLEHPGIVPVYGLGTDAEGRPFYAMRFIRGGSLKEAIAHFHADEGPKPDPGRQSLELHQLLRRFVDICNAVAYAHGRGVLHRDLKPGNVIVGRYGETLVVDWGLAKPLGHAEPTYGAEERTLVPSSGSGTAGTLPGSALGTPAYMSPEQAAGDLEHVGPRSDVYSLGATLYCLLTGRAPFEGDDLGAILRGVQEGDFPAPRVVNPRIDRALEAVCLKAMAIDPKGRYMSARTLAEDVERWMADEPVAAWREPILTRLRRGMRRHRTLVTSVAASALVGLGVLLASQAQANQTLKSYNRRLLEANRGEQAAKASAQARFDLALEAVNAYHAGASEDVLLKQPELEALRTSLLRTSLDFYRKLKAALEQSPWSDAKAQTDLADATFQVASLTDAIGSKEKALEGYWQAQELLEILARTHPSQVHLRRLQAQCYNKTGLLLREISQSAEAQRTFSEARDVLQRVVQLDPDSADDQRDLAAIIGNIGDLLRDTGRPQEALRVYRQASDLLERRHEVQPSNERDLHALARSQHNIARLEGENGRVSEAIRDFQRARKQISELSVAHPASASYALDLAVVETNFGLLQFNSGNLAEALSCFCTARDVMERLVRDHPMVTRYQRSFAQYLNNVGVVQKSMGRTDEALASYRRARDLQERLVHEYPTVNEYRRALAGTYSNLGLLHQEGGDLDGALEDLGRARDHQEKLVRSEPGFPRYRRDLALTLTNMGPVLNAVGRREEALRTLEQAIDLQRPLGDANPSMLMYQSDLSMSYVSLGIVQRALGRRDEARQSLQQARERLDRLPRLGSNDRLTLATILAQSIPIAEEGGMNDGRRLGDQAIEQLRTAIRNGYANIHALRNDPALDPLRDRLDFQALLLDLAFPVDPFAR